jgi:hypothetical protein
MIFLIYLITMMRALICRICNHGHPVILPIMVEIFSSVLTVIFLIEGLL